METINSTNQNIDLIKLLKREQNDVTSIVSEILQNVKQNGDQAVVQYSSKFDGVDSNSVRTMKRTELESYVSMVKTSLTKSQIDAIDTAYRNVTWFAEKSIPKNWIETGIDGQRAGEQFTPLNRVACYVPQGSFPLISTVIHTCAIAQTCGVKEIVIVTSPSKEDLNPAFAYAAYISGVTEIIFAGGAQGIGAVAYGTETINNVDFICGPGNAYVAEAKRQVFGEVGIDMIAGPSEVFIIADKTALPYNIACDLLAQAEHGSGFERSVLLTDSAELINKVKKELEDLKPRIKNNPGFEKVWENNIFLILTADVRQAMEISNSYGPEHLELQVNNAQDLLNQITSAGAVFIGNYSAEPLGDFVIGPSHVLPTNSTARFSSGLSSGSFFKRTSILEIDSQTYSKLCDFSKEFADMEGLTAHGISSISRKDTNVSTK
ncbi:MAG: histidinol dehydrogenase [Acidimicrobiia bacterium]